MTTIFFDIETGGLRIAQPIIQLAAIAVNNGFEELEACEWKLQFSEIECDPEALLVNHYNAEIWKEKAVPRRLALAEFCSMLERYKDVRMISKRGSPYYVARLAAHNASFDDDRIRYHHKETLGGFFPAAFNPLCTMQRALWYFSEHPELRPPVNYKLGTLCEGFGIEIEGAAHDALTDVRMTIALAKALRGIPS